MTLIIMLVIGTLTYRYVTYTAPAPKPQLRHTSVWMFLFRIFPKQLRFSLVVFHMGSILSDKQKV